MRAAAVLHIGVGTSDIRPNRERSSSAIGRRRGGGCKCARQLEVARGMNMPHASVSRCHETKQCLLRTFTELCVTCAVLHAGDERELNQCFNCYASSPIKSIPP